MITQRRTICEILHERRSCDYDVRRSIMTKGPMQMVLGAEIDLCSRYPPRRASNGKSLAISRSAEFLTDFTFSSGLKLIKISSSALTERAQAATHHRDSLET